ncbi:hypothetical protein [Novosphingobium sp.]|uniref:hypothetical protein n=1 Tax=Novosphingobium sp. TaxID=1874826 RepID=UPI003BAC1AA9
MSDDQNNPPADSDWLPAYEAYRLVCERNGSVEADLSIARRAHAGQIRTLAEIVIKEQRTARSRKEIVEEKRVELPKGFWWAEGEAALEQDWTTGDFATEVCDNFSGPGQYRWQAFGVRFERRGIEMMLTPAKSSESVSVVASYKEIAAQAPLPTDEEIIAKMKELAEMGIERDKAAKIIRQIRGFEGVGNEHARRAASGHLTQGRPKKSRPN